MKFGILNFFDTYYIIRSFHSLNMEYSYKQVPFISISIYLTGKVYKNDHNHFNHVKSWFQWNLWLCLYLDVSITMDSIGICKIIDPDNADMKMY